VAIRGSLLATAYAVMQFLCAPVLGAVSDRFGRRPVLLLSLAVMAVDYVGSALAQSMGVLLLLRLLAGVTAATHGSGCFDTTRTRYRRAMVARHNVVSIIANALPMHTRGPPPNGKYA